MQCVLECHMLDNDPNKVWIGVDHEEEVQWQGAIVMNCWLVDASLDDSGRLRDLLLLVMIERMIRWLEKRFLYSEVSRGAQQKK